MDREYIDVETPVGKVKLKMKKWLTAGEKVAIVKANKDDFEAMNKLTIDLVLVDPPSYDSMMEWHGKDFDFLMTKVAEIIGESSLAPKAQTSSETTPA